MTVLEYVRPDGSNPYREWFDRLDPLAAAKVATAVTRLELGNTSQVKWIGGIGDALTILLGGGTKRRQDRDIERAKAMWAEYQGRKAQAAGMRGRR